MSTFDGSAGSSATQEPETLYCANHPNVPTYLRCGRCGKPICAKCRVATPVGHRCIECARLSVLPTYAVQSTQYSRAIAFGFGVATLVGVLWGLLPGYQFWMALIMGIATGEAVSAAVNMKRGPGLQYVALAAVAWGVVVSRIVLGWLLQNAINVLAAIPGNPNDVVLALWRRSADFAHIWQLTIGNGGLQSADFTGVFIIIMAFALAFIRLR